MSIRNEGSNVWSGKYRFPVQVYSMLVRDIRVDTRLALEYAFLMDEKRLYLETMLSDVVVGVTSAVLLNSARTALPSNPQNVLELFFADPRLDAGAENNYLLRYGNIPPSAISLERILYFLSSLSFANVNKHKNLYSETSRHGHADAIAVLLSRPDVAKAGGGEQALSVACLCGHVRAVQMLLAVKDVVRISAEYAGTSRS